MEIGYEVSDILVKPVSHGEILKALKRRGVQPSSRHPIFVDSKGLDLQASDILRSLFPRRSESIT
jgi:hypothetical protein